MAVDRIIGVDFGTSTSVIRVKRYQNWKPVGERLDTKEVVFGGVGGVVPTVIMKSKDDPSVVYYGYEALVKRKNMQQFHSFKVDLESPDAAKREQARALTEEFFRFMARQYRAQSKDGHLGDADDKEHTIVSYPVKWSKESKDFMVLTAQNAGFPDVIGMDEAQAAIHAVTVQSAGYLVHKELMKKGVPSTILLIDMGAGTTDLVLCRYTQDDAPQTEILSVWPRDGGILFGGKEIDVLLQNFFRDKMDADDARLVFKRVGVEKFKAWKESVVSPALMRGDTVSDFEALDNCVELAEIDMPDYCLDRAGLEKCLSEYLKQLPLLIDGCIRDAKIKADAVDLVIVTGGHSQWYFVQEMLAGKMPQFGKVDLPKIRENPSRIIPISRPQETVALGLAYGILKAEIDFPTPKPVPEPPNPSDEAEYTPESEFELLAEGEGYLISKYTGNRKVVMIPPVIRGRNVVAIGEFAFCTIIENPRWKEWNSQGFWGRLSSDVPEPVKYINPSSVEKVVLPDTVSRIGRGAFLACGNLHTVIAGQGLRIIEGKRKDKLYNYFSGAFAYCSKLHTFRANSNVVNIGPYAFFSCSKLEFMDFGMGDSGMGDIVAGVAKFPKSLNSLGDSSMLFTSIREITLNKKTAWKKSIFGNNENAIDQGSCAIFYYD